MEDTIKNEQKPQNNIKVLLIILIVLVLLLISGVYALLGLKLLLAEKTGKENKTTIIENNNKEESETKVEDKNETTQVEEKKEITDKTTMPKVAEEEDNTPKVQLKDTFVLDIQTEEAGETNTVILNYMFLKDGKVYVNHKVLDNVGSEDDPYYDFSAPTLSFSYSRNIEGKEIEGLPPIKRIKGTYQPGTDPTTAVLLVAENGEVYSYEISVWANGKVEKAKYLDDYKVDDIINYYVVGGCISDNPNFKTCGGEYHIIDQNGKTYHYVVNTDGSLTEK